MVKLSRITVCEWNCTKLLSIFTLSLKIYKWITRRFLLGLPLNSQVIWEFQFPPQHPWYRFIQVHDRTETSYSLYLSIYSLCHLSSSQIHRNWFLYRSVIQILSAWLCTDLKRQPLDYVSGVSDCGHWMKKKSQGKVVPPDRTQYWKDLCLTDQVQFPHSCTPQIRVIKWTTIYRYLLWHLQSTTCSFLTCNRKMMLAIGTDDVLSACNSRGLGRQKKLSRCHNADQHLYCGEGQGSPSDSQGDRDSSERSTWEKEKKIPT